MIGVACEFGQIEIVKWLVQDHQMDIHLDNEWPFKEAYKNGQIEMVKWLVKNHQVNIHENNEDAFQWVCYNNDTKLINWFVKKYRHTEKPYYFYKNTAYILNHEPLSDWESCTILGCPVLYIGELDEPAVIAYMATLKRPKSARS